MSISGSGQLDVLRYGHVFKARQLAAVRGAGDYYDGKYYVKSVTHNIKRGEYKQSFSLARGGVGSSVSIGERMKEGPKYYGIYRGTVVNNIDPLQIGRILATVPDVGGMMPTTWAMPCVPIAGKQMGIFMVPQIGAGVWIQFEAGDPDRPVWTGGWWGSAAEVPALALAGVPGNPNIVIQTACCRTRSSSAICPGRPAASC